MARAALIVGGDALARERKRITDAIDKHDGAFKLVAAELGISPASLYRTLDDYELSEHMKARRKASRERRNLAT